MSVDYIFTLKIYPFATNVPICICLIIYERRFCSCLSSISLGLLPPLLLQKFFKVDKKYNGTATVRIFTSLIDHLR